jgi:capsular polysaccharide export protein
VSPELLDFLQKERAGGKKIICIFGKVLFDLGMPRGDGPAHATMREWFEHTLEIASRASHIHLVIKPHPHELRDEIALYPTEKLEDWLPTPMPANVHWLAHNQFNLFEVSQVIDLALLWNGTSALELGVLGIPTIIGAYYGAIDYPVGHILPESRAHYEMLLTSRDSIQVSPEVKLRSAALIEYLRHREVSIPYRYTHRGLTNQSIREPRWFEEDLLAFRSKGDDNVTYIADRISAQMLDQPVRTEHERFEKTTRVGAS